MSISRSNRGVIEDLELRLAPSFPLKGGMLANNYISGHPSNFITIDDDDDDVQIYSPRPPREVNTCEIIPLY